MHTPGPWRVAPQSHVEGISGENLARSICASTSPHVTWVLAEWVRPDDAGLMAASPEMLEVLASLADAYDSLLEAHGKPHGWGKLESEAARNVIARATGQTR